MEGEILFNNQITLTHPANELNEALLAATNQLAASSRRIYVTAAANFANWLQKENLTLSTLTFLKMTEYRRYLEDNYARATASRLLVVARRLLDQAVKLDIIPANPAHDVKGFKAVDNETPHTALSKKEAKELLESIDTATAKGKRDFALIMLLLRTGMRRAEAAGLTMSDLGTEAGHNVAVIRHGKGNKRRKAKIPVDVRRSIDIYLEACGRKEKEANAPLFVRFKKGDKPKETGLDWLDIERIVEGYAKRIGIKLSPHGLRASFVTLALEGGAKLEQVQYAAGHADPRTTERYQKRKLNLDVNAVDFIRIE
jgi:integrase/recombinase XerD